MKCKTQPQTMNPNLTEVLCSFLHPNPKTVTLVTQPFPKPSSNGDILLFRSLVIPKVHYSEYTISLVYSESLN